MTGLRVALVGALLVIAVVVPLVAGSWPSQRPVSYWEIEDRYLGLMVIGGPASTCFVESTDETSTEVRISVKCGEPLITIGSTGAGYRYFFEVLLEEPLAGRLVIDGTGAPATRCAKPRC